MSDEGRVDELLKELLDSGDTPEAVCHSCPELLAPLRARWHKLRALQAAVGVFFPESTSVGGANPKAKNSQTLPLAELPSIPGYEVQEVLGYGGMGVVYKAWHPRLQRPVAVKMLLAGAYAQPQELERFLREAEMLAGLCHPNIVQIHEAGDVDGRPYFTMEFVEGGSLADKLAGTPQPARQAAALLACVAEAVHAAHQRGIVHRDLKPGNILLTPDGTPKLTDFGLARRFEGTARLTQSGIPVGTPSYMAPEQAEGKSRDIGPAADIYALGAIMYEMLTGRPPFRADTATETLRQVISQDPVPPSQLNMAVPRDPGTICLKCLEKDPLRRYASAAAFAEDLQRFQRNEPIVARPVGFLERGLRWTRRKPTAAALVAMAVVLVGLAIGGGLWLEREWADRRAELSLQEQAVANALEKAKELGEHGRWRQAAALLDSISAPANLQQRLDRARADAVMASKLEEVRERLSAVPEKTREVADPLYAEIFRSYGIDLELLEASEAARRVDNSAIRETLVAFLHDWLYWSRGAHPGKLRDVLDRVDNDPWRRAFREALVDRDTPAAKDAMKKLAMAPEASVQPALFLSGLGGVLLANEQREEALALLREAQQRHPDDFWLNYLLGHYWETERPQVAVGYFRAAAAIRPGSDETYTHLGMALGDAGDEEGAIAALRRSLELKPTSAVARGLAKFLAPRGRLEEAREVWEKVLERNPPDHDAWYGYAQLCLFLGKQEAYRRARKALLEHFGGTDEWTIAERTSLACLLQPLPEDELRRVLVLTDKAVTAESNPDPDNPYLEFLKGLAEYRQGRPRQAVPWLEKSAGKLPNRAGPHLVLAMAQFQSGSVKEARKSLAAAVSAYNWKESQATHATVWISHVLRREAEGLILPKLSAFVRGAWQPQDNDERLALLGTCQSRALYAAAARLCADAFAADPDLAERLTSQCLHRATEESNQIDQIEALNTEGRYLAARCAALAGCGLGTDGPRLSEAERTHWRRKAREWLHADLLVWSKTINDPRADRKLTRMMLTLWQDEPDLAGLREPTALHKLARDEREKCLALWDEVATMHKRAR